MKLLDALRSSVGVLLLAGCGGGVMHLGDNQGDQSTDGGQAGAGGAAGAAGGGVGAQAPSCAPNATISEVLTLTNVEFDRTIRDLLRDPSAPSITNHFPDDDLTIGFRRDVAPQAGPLLLAPYDQRYSSIAQAVQQIAKTAAAHLDRILPCDPASIGEDACAAQFIEKFGLRAYRRPLTDAEAAAYGGTYKDLRATSDFATAIENVVLGMLSSRSFLTIVDSGPQGTLTQLDPYALASRLSYFIYRSMPDQELFDAAASGGLATPEDIGLQVSRMLKSSRAHEAVVDFFTEWLTLDRLTGTPWQPDAIVKDATLFPEFDGLRVYMKTETQKFGESIFFGDGQWSSVLKSTRTWLNEPLAKFYGVGSVTGLDFREVNGDSATRAGVLTHASIMALTSGVNESSVVDRGVFVLEKFLCQEWPPPPAGLNPVLPPLMPGQTNRGRYESVIVDPACKGCHEPMDGIGFGFEEFDAIGRYRSMENDLPIDATGTLSFSGDGTDGSYNGAIELSAKLAASTVAQECAAKQWFRFALGRLEGEEDACSLNAALGAVRSTGNLRELVVAIATSDAFRYARW
jgi:hypothetical protein